MAAATVAEIQRAAEQALTLGGQIRIGRDAKTGEGRL
jgi:hypothetical protein